MTVNLTGSRSGMLVAVKRTGTDKFRKPLWLVHCDCGNDKVVPGYKIRSGAYQSCGCSRQDNIALACTTHGYRKHPLYAVWLAMKGRCKYLSLIHI